jgi:hypothetical protein
VAEPLLRAEASLHLIKSGLVQCDNAGDKSLR